MISAAEAAKLAHRLGVGDRSVVSYLLILVALRRSAMSAQDISAKFARTSDAKLALMWWEAAGTRSQLARSCPSPPSYI